MCSQQAKRSSNNHIAELTTPAEAGGLCLQPCASSSIRPLQHQPSAAVHHGPTGAGGQGREGTADLIIRVKEQVKPPLDTVHTG